MRTMQKLEVIPDSRRDAVQAALRATFGACTIDRFDPLKGGVSGAQILRFDVRERTYVLRIEPERVALRDRQRGYECMVAAAAAGAAPNVHFTDPAAGVAIMDFISGRPLSQHPGGPVGMVRALGVLIAKVQATAPFPAIGSYPDLIEQLLASLCESELLISGELAPHAEGLARIRAALPWTASALVSCHNDPNPRNILFDRERALLIDWELAFRNDPLVDVAILTTDLAETPELQSALLEATFGSTPDDRLHARLVIIRLLTRLFYGCIVLDSLAGSLRSRPRSGLATFTPASFRVAVAEGRLKSGTVETAYAFAMMSLAAFIDGMTAPGLSESLKRVACG
jgi:Phosphotransferase enzyme family